MPRPVGLVVWRDARTDPPTGESRVVLAIHMDGSVVFTVTNRPLAPRIDTVFTRWAEMPSVESGLTVDDVKWAATVATETAAAANPGAMDEWKGIKQRFVAALGGEKEET